MSNLFKPATLKEHAFLLASHLPPGKLWKTAFDLTDDFGKLILGLSLEFRRSQVTEEKFYNELDINKTSELLTEWEKSVGIPNDYFSITAKPTSQRRIQIEQIFAKFGGVQKAEDLVRVAAVFGMTITVISGEEEGSIVDDKERAHTIFADITASTYSIDDFPILFPIPFNTAGTDFLQSIFDTIIPANVQIIITSSV